jgi:hypothetical protein
MSAKQRIQRLEKHAPKNAPKADVNPFIGMSKKELLQRLKIMIESGEYEKPEYTNLIRLAKNTLTQNGIEWTVKHDNE